MKEKAAYNTTYAQCGSELQMARQWLAGKTKSKLTR